MVLNMLHDQLAELSVIQGNIANFLNATDAMSSEFEASRMEAMFFSSSLNHQIHQLNQAIEMVEEAENPEDPSLVLSAMSVIMQAPTAPVIMPATSFTLQ